MLQCAYGPIDQVDAAPESMLGAVCFSPLSVPLSASGVPMVHVPMPALDVAGCTDASCEVWRTSGVLTYGQHNAVQYGYNEHVLFGVLQLAEADFDTAAVRAADKTPLQQASETAYLALFEVLDVLHFPHILRVWNYLADINGNSHGTERYRQFNLGRQDGFLASGRAITGCVPAASAVGFVAGPLTIYFLAGRGAAPIAIENPRQVSAYQYPAAYGARSPTFSRASVVRLGERDVLFLSGTASIVGHETRHAGDVLAQTRETVANIDAMVREANRVTPQAGFTLDDLCYKVYVRDEKDVAAIHAELRRLLGPAARLMFLRADICRADLAMEIEASAGYRLDVAGVR